MPIETLDDNLNQINKRFFHELENRHLILEGDNIMLMEDKSQISANDIIISMLRQNGYDLNSIKDKRQKIIYY